MDGEEPWSHRPTAPPPHRSRRARAPQALASALARAEVDGAVLVVVIAPALAPPRSADAVVREWWCLWLPAPLSVR